MKFTHKYHGLSADGQQMQFAVSFGNYSKIISVSLEQGRGMLEKSQAEDALREEAARFNQFRRK